MKMNRQKAIAWIKEYWTMLLFGIIISMIIVIIVLAIYQSAIQPKEGMVVQKNYTPPYTTTNYHTITQSNGKTMRIPIQEHHEARYMIVIRGIDKKGNESFGYYDVTPMEYENIKIGDYYIHQSE